MLQFLEFGGRLCVGSDSQSTVDPSEELRWLEYQQRLRSEMRSSWCARALISLTMATNMVIFLAEATIWLKSAEVPVNPW